MVLQLLDRKKIKKTLLGSSNISSHVKYNPTEWEGNDGERGKPRNKMDCKKNRNNNKEKLSENNERGGNKCRVLPSTELQEGGPEARLFPDHVPCPCLFAGSPNHSWSTRHKGRKGASKDCFGGRPHCSEALLGGWGLLDKDYYTPQRLPRGSSFLSILRNER